MRSGIRWNSPVFCPLSSCGGGLPEGVEGPYLRPRVRKRGSFTRKGSLKRIRRYQCLHCGHSYSQATFLPEFKQQRRELNLAIEKILCSLVSERRAALLLGVSRRLIARRTHFLKIQAKRFQEKEFQDRIERGLLYEDLQFDEMESFEHTKCKPLSIGLLVDAKTREILGVSVASMPATGLLAQISRKKYGWRKDERAKEAKLLFTRLSEVIHPEAQIASDQNPKYPGWLKSTLPQIRHTAHKGRKPRSAGQGELKKGYLDPLFSLNHTAAMIRANVSRLIRKTWCTTKKAENLRARLWVYLHFHNTQLLQLTPSVG